MIRTKPGIYTFPITVRLLKFTLTSKSEKNKCFNFLFENVALGQNKNWWSGHGHIPLGLCHIYQKL